MNQTKVQGNKQLGFVEQIEEPSNEQGEMQTVSPCSFGQSTI